MARMTCNQHANMIQALVPEESMGPNVKKIYDKLRAEGDEECIQAEGQIVYLFQSMLARDLAGKPADE